MSSFNDVNRYLDYRIKMASKQGVEDSWATDKKWRKENLDNFFSCKWCGQKMYAAEYEKGTIIFSCRKPLCPGNIDSGMANLIKPHQLDIKEMTNQYLFNSRLKF